MWRRTLPKDFPASQPRRPLLPVVPFARRLQQDGEVVMVPHPSARSGLQAKDS
ncbi:hypothetical protein [Azospirillum doebereinerae]